MSAGQISQRAEVCLVFWITPHYILFDMYSCAATFKSEMPRKTQSKILSFCSNQNRKTGSQKTDTLTGSSSIRAPTNPRSLHVLPFNMEPECGRCRCIGRRSCPLTLEENGQKCVGNPNYVYPF